MLTALQSEPILFECHHLATFIPIIAPKVVLLSGKPKTFENGIIRSLVGNERNHSASISPAVDATGTCTGTLLDGKR